MTDPTVPDEASDASTLLEVLAEAADDGFATQIMVTDDGELRCTKCDTTVSAAEFDVQGFRRLEGASDPSDMLIVIWGTCAGCGEGRVATIGYGPTRARPTARCSTRSISIMPPTRWVRPATRRTDRRGRHRMRAAGTRNRS